MSDWCQCVTLHKIKKHLLKRGLVFAFGLTGNWVTLVNTKQRYKKDANCLTSCIVPHWYTNLTLPHCLPLTSSHTPSATLTLICKQKRGIVFSGSWNTVCHTIPALCWLYFRNCARPGVQRYLFAQSLQDVAHRQALAALPRILYNEPPETRQRYCSLRHSEWEKQSREEWGRERRWVQRVLRAVDRAQQKCDSVVRKKAKWFKERTEREGQEQQHRCMSDIG